MAKKTEKLDDTISMTVVGKVVFCREFTKGMHIRVQANIKDKTQITQGITLWDNDEDRPEVGNGDRVYVEGYPKINTYQKDGETKASVDCIAREFRILEKGSEDDDEI